MPMPVLSAAVLEGAKLRLPNLSVPDLDRFITPESPAIALQLAPALEDLVALTDGIPASLPLQIEQLLAAQAGSAVPGASVVGVAVGEKPDYALLRANPDSLANDEKQRRFLELEKLLARRQSFGVYFGPEGSSGLAGRRKGVGQLDLTLDLNPLVNRTGAPFAMRIGLGAVEATVNAAIQSEQPRYSLSGEACPCGPIVVNTVSIRNPSSGKLELVAGAQVDLLLGAAHAAIELHVAETIGVDSRGDQPGILADPDPAASINVLQIVGTQLTDKLKKALERDIVHNLLLRVAPIGSLLAMALRALASRIATNKALDGEDVQGPFHDALERVLAPRLVQGTDQKILFDLKSAGASGQQISLGGTVLVVERQRTLRIRPRAAGRRAADAGPQVFDIRFRALSADLAEPVRYVWKCLGQEQTGGADVEFQVDLAANPEFTVSLSAVDADGFAVPDALKQEVRARFRAAGPAIFGLVTLTGTPLR